MFHCSFQLPLKELASLHFDIYITLIENDTTHINQWSDLLIYFHKIFPFLITQITD